MRIWDAFRRFSNPSQSRLERMAARGRKARDLRVEQFEDRVLLSITPSWDDSEFTRVVTRAVEQSCDLSQYTTDQLLATEEWVIGFDASADAVDAAAEVGGDLLEEAGLLPDTYIVQFDPAADWEEVVSLLSAASDVDYFYPLVAQQQSDRLVPDDTLFPNQWHLDNTGQGGGTAGADANITEAWDLFTGEGVVIGIVDDGLEYSHVDLTSQYRSDLSYDFNFDDADPSPDLASDGHGTSVAGVAAATGNNAEGVIGSGFGAQLAGLRLTSTGSTDADEAAALTYMMDEVDIYNNSWGPYDTGTHAAPGPLTAAALAYAATNGRGGLGSIYVWAGGNGREYSDNVNYDGYANSRYTIAVGAIDDSGEQSYYSEPGACLLVSAYSNGGASGITTTDRTGADGYDTGNYTNTFGGTSSATPLVSGVIAMMLEANPNLTYRDVQHILVNSAAMNDPTDSDWTTNAAGLHVNHKYGFGSIDALAAVQLAETWTTVADEVSLHSGTVTVGTDIPDNDSTGVASTITMDGTVGSIEWVEVTVTIPHDSVGDLEIVLTAPSGTQSVLSEAHYDVTPGGYVQWTFTTARNWGESSAGDWTLEVRDRVAGTTGSLTSWSLDIYGTAAATAAPDLVSLIFDSGDIALPSESPALLYISPNEMTLRFNQGQTIDTNTLDAISVVRSVDGIFGNGDDETMPIGWIGAGDNANEIIVRFAETLPDDLYQLVIVGTGSSPLTNAAGQPFRNGEEDLAMPFELDLGAEITSVVPQPVTRDTSGALVQQRDQIEIYFSEDLLNEASAENVNLYQLINTGNSATTADDSVITPTSAVYLADENKVTLTFAQDLALYGTGAYRLRVGSRYTEVQTSHVSLLSSDAGTTFYDAVDLTSTLETLSTQVNADGDPVSLILSAAITAQDYSIEWPGSLDDPSARDLSDYPDILIEDHYMSGTGAEVDTSTGAVTVYYNFADIYGADQSGTPLHNLITDAQMDLARQIFSLLGYYLGVQFVETDSSGIQVATGDLAALGMQSGVGGVAGLGGGGIALMDYADFTNDTGLFAGGWFTVAMHEIMHNLSFGHTYDLVDSIMGNKTAGTDELYPTSADIIHGLYMYRADSTDIDMYQVDLDEAGTLSTEVLAERLEDASLLDSTITIYEQYEIEQAYQVEVNGEMVTKTETVTSYRAIASNDDYYSADSFLELYLQAGTYFIGVSAAGNDNYDPSVEDSGVGGVTQGRYDLRVNFTPDGVDATDVTTFTATSATNIIDQERGVMLDGDADGVPGGNYNYWFNVATAADTLFVDKASTATTANGTLSAPYKTIKQAIAASSSGDIIRIVGNDVGNDGDLSNDLAYNIGYSSLGKALSDGTSFDVPQGVTVMIDAGTILKLSGKNISVGSSAEGESSNRSSGSLQVLGTPTQSVYFTSYFDETIGVDSEPLLTTTPGAGDWGGLVFRNDIDNEFIEGYNPSSGYVARTNLENEGIFLNYVNHADIRFGGGSIGLDPVTGDAAVYQPIYLAESRATVTYNTITNSADAAMSADPNSFADTKFESWDWYQPFTADYDRVGPEIHGNILTADYATSKTGTVVTHVNSINGLFVRIRTDSGDVIDELEVCARFDDLDIVHIVSEALTINGTPADAVVEANTCNVTLREGYVLATPAASTGTTRNIQDADTFTIFDGNNTVTFEFNLIGGTTSTAGSVVIPFLQTYTATQMAQTIATAINSAHTSRGLQVRVDATPTTGRVQLVVESSDIEFYGLLGTKAGNGLLKTATDARLLIDSGVIVKLNGGRIETEFGAQLIAEGRSPTTDGAAGYPVVFTSILDQRYGAGGVFDTSEDTSGQAAAAGDWGGITFAPTSKGSLDEVVIAYAGGICAIEGGFAGFNPIEMRQADVRIANSRFEYNGANDAGDRNGRGTTEEGTIFVRGSQPVIVGNDFLHNEGPIVNIDCNALSSDIVTDWGRSTGFLGAYDAYEDNHGPLVRENTMTDNDVNGMEIRGGNVTTESVWDDTDIVHVLQEEIVVSEYHHGGGVRLESSSNASLVVKLLGNSAGFTASGSTLETDDRIGGIVQIVGQPGYAVVLTSLNDDSVGAGFDIDGQPQFDTDGDGTFTPASAGDWRSVRLEAYSHDRNVAVVNESELAVGLTEDANSTPLTSEYLGELAASEADGDDNQRLGFQVQGYIRSDASDDADVYSFDAVAGTEVWIDVDLTTFAMDSVIELIDANGNVIARSDDSRNTTAEPADGTMYDGLARGMDRDQWVRDGWDYLSINPADAGFRAVLPGTEGYTYTYYVRVRSALAITDIASAANTLDGTTFLVGNDNAAFYFEIDNPVASNYSAGQTDPDAVLITLASGDTAAQVAQKIADAINGALGALDAPVTASVRTDGSVRIDGMHATFNPLASGLTKLANTSGDYTFQVRLQEINEVAGSTVNYADIRYATNGIEVLGFPQHSLLLNETIEVESTGQGTNDSPTQSQSLGNLLSSDRNTLAISAYLDGSTDVDWYTFTVDYEGIQSIPGINDSGSVFATIFDIDYASGMARPDLEMYVFDSSGELVLQAHESSVSDDRNLASDGADLDDLSRGSEGSADPYLGTVYLPEGTYYIAVTSVLSTAAATTPATSLTRLEPIEVVNRIAEEHVEDDDASYAHLSDETDRITLTPDEYNLGDVTLYVNTSTGLYTVDPFTGAVETNVTYNSRIGGSNTYADIDMRNDGMLVTSPGNTANWAVINTGNGSTLDANVNEGIQIYHMNANYDGIEAFGGGLTITAISNRPEEDYWRENNLYDRLTYVVGQINPSGFRVGGTATYFRNLLYVYGTNGTAIQRYNEPTGNRYFSNIIPQGSLTTAPTIFLAASGATQINPPYNNTNGDNYPDEDMVDGTTFTVTYDATGTANDVTTVFEMDSGVSVSTPSTGPAGLRDGDLFTLTVDGTPITFEFDSGRCLVASTTTGVADGDSFNVTGADGSLVTFEFDSNNSVTPGRQQIVFTPGSTGQTIAQLMVNAINAYTANNAAFAVVASANGARVTLENDLGCGTASAALSVPGQYGNQNGGLAIDFEETWSGVTLGTSLENTVEANTGGLVDVGYADRSGTAAQLGTYGDRITFGLSATAPATTTLTFNAGTSTLSYLGGAVGVSGTRTAVRYTAGDDATTLAQTMAAAVNAAAVADPTFQVAATAYGGQLEFTATGTANASVNLSVSSNLAMDVDGAGVGGEITGIAWLDDSHLYAVTSNGGLYRIVNPDNYQFYGVEPDSGYWYIGEGNGGPSLEFIADLGINFSGLVQGPENVEDSRFANMLFATDSGGNIYAFNTEGVLQPIFLDGATSVSTGVGGLEGITFSCIDYNLWHVTQARSDDAGHGVYTTYDDSRISSTDRVNTGRQSYYFGLDTAEDGTWNETQAGAEHFDTNSGIWQTYNVPNGAYGSLTSSTFSLVGYSVNDEPTVYFNYFAETENSNSWDGFRVYVSTDGANWDLVGTNTDLDWYGVSGLRQTEGVTNSYLVEHYDTGDGWRQARVDLSYWAGLDNLRLRFDFSTASDMDVGDTGTTGDYLTAVDAEQLRDGQSFTIDGETFELDMGYALVTPNVAGTLIQDGEYFDVEDADGNVLRFEFDKGDGAIDPLSNVMISVVDSMTPTEVADAIAVAIETQRAAGTLNVLAYRANYSLYDESDPDTWGVDDRRLFLIGAQSVTLSSGSVLFLQGDAPGTLTTAGAVAVPLRGDMTADQVAQILLKVIDQHFASDDTIQIEDASTIWLGDTFSLRDDQPTSEDNDGTGDLFRTLTFQFVDAAAYSVPQLLPNGNFAVPITVGSTESVMADAIADAINAAAGQGLINVTALQVSTDEVQVSGDLVLFDALTSPLTLSNYNETAAKLDDANGYILHIIGHALDADDDGTIAFGIATSLYADQTSKNYGSSNAGDRFNSFQRGQRNSYEGVYIDDIIIGLAERGEMATNASSNMTINTSTTIPTTYPVVEGAYTLEIRRAEDYGTYYTTPIRYLDIDDGLRIDANDRLTNDITLYAPPASSIAHGDTFSIYDGLNWLQFMFLDQDLGGNAGNAIAIYFTQDDTDADIGKLVADAINGQDIIDVTAMSLSWDGDWGSFRVDLTGAVSVDVEISDVQYEFWSGRYGGDDNSEREKGQIVISNNSVTYAEQYGIVVMPDDDTDATHPGGGRTVNSVNEYATGILVENNVVAYGLAGGIRFEGDPQGLGAVPYGKIVNNTIYGYQGATAGGTGLLIANNAGPTVLNNVFANLAVGISVDSSSLGDTVIGGSVYHGTNLQNAVGTGLGSYAMTVDASVSLFVDADGGNFYPDNDSPLIDSSINTLEERQTYYNRVLQPAGISVSPILAPTLDMYGQVRRDDPDVSSPLGLGANVFKDRGAVDRVDFFGPAATLVDPVDNDTNTPVIDQDRDLYDVRLVGQVVTQFVIQLSDSGIGINDATVVAANLRVFRDDIELTEGIDYIFEYNSTNDVIYLYPASGVWQSGYTYTVELVNAAITDMANNPLSANRPDGSTNFVIAVAGLDFGDAPDPTYPSLESSNGATHVVTGDYLGSSASTETDARCPDGDTLDNGVTFPSGLASGTTVPLEIVVTSDGWINGWFDFNTDGDWNDAGEKVFDGVAVTAGTNTLNVTVPDGLPSGWTYSRFRYSTSQQYLDLTGQAPDGEVEDYAVQIVENLDYGDAPEGYHTLNSENAACHTISSDLYLGTVVPDLDIDGHPDSLAEGDDNDGTDDEDGVTVNDPIVPDTTVSITVVVGGTQNGLLQGWIDFDGDGNWSTLNSDLTLRDQIFKNVVVTPGVNELTFTVPADAAVDIFTYARFRLSTDTGLGFSGAASDGEVEDYLVQIIEAPLDFGDAPDAYGTIATSGGATHVVGDLFLGTSVDYEIDGHASTDATGDDAAGVDDEDGVAFLGDLTPDTTVQLSVVASKAGYLQGWIDWNGDGDFADEHEQIITNGLLSAGTNTISILVPETVDGVGLENIDTFARFRFSSQQDLAPTGEALDGEVEDYQVRLNVGDATITGWKFDDVNANGVWDLGVTTDVSVTMSSTTATTLAFSGVDSDGVTYTDVTQANDLVSGPIDLGFDFEFFGQTYNQLYVSVNGLVAFGNDGATMTDFVEAGLAASSVPVLAPFWADADTRGTGSVTMNQGTSSSTGNRYIQINWVGVGSYNANTDQRNSFTLYIENSSTLGDLVVFQYDSATNTNELEWTTGDNQGTDGFGGSGADIGFASGDGTYTSLFRPDSEEDLARLLTVGRYVFRFNSVTGLPVREESGLAGVLIYVDSDNDGAFDYTDVDGDGAFDPAIDTKIEEYAITQEDDPATTTVDETGYYELNNLFSDQSPFVIREIVPEGWTSTFPGTSSAVVLGTDGSQSNADGSYTIDLDPDEIQTDVNFGNFERGTLTITDAEVVEGNSGTTTITFDVHLSGAFGAGVSVDWVTQGGTATEGVDYLAGSGTVNFTPQESPGSTWDTSVLTTNSTNDYDYSVSGNRVAWEGYDGTDWEIYLYDATTGITRQLTNNNWDDRSVTISGDNIVWSSYDGSDYEVFLYDGTDVLQLTDNTFDDKDPRVSDSAVTWWTKTTTNNEIYYYNIASATLKNISNSSANDYEPQISGNCVAWYGATGTADSSYEVYVFDGTTTRQITSDSVRDRNVQIDGNSVVWEKVTTSTAGTGSDIYHYDIASRVTTRLTTSPTSQYQNPQISGDNLVFQGNDGYDWEIYAMDLSQLGSGTLTARNISQNYLFDENPEVCGDRVVWHTHTGSQWEVMYYEIGGTLGAQNVSSNSTYDWYPQVSDDLVVWRNYDPVGGDYEILIATEQAPEVAMSVTVTVVGDTAVEADELFSVLLSNAQYADIVIDEQVGAILNDDGKLDFGDAPDPKYATLLANNGARHVIQSGFYLGSTIDVESNGKPNATATGDDVSGVDDEDGVAFGTLIQGTDASASIVMAGTGTGYIDAWIDFNGDGDWEDSGEQIAASAAVAAGTNTITFEVPDYANLGTTFARVRLSRTGGLASTGTGLTGEVEDYAVAIQSNLNFSGKTLTVSGSAFDDEFIFTSGDSFSVDFNGTHYTYPVSAVNAIVFNGGGGADTAIFNGSSARTETVTLRPNAATYAVSNVITVQANAITESAANGGDSADSLVLYDSAGNDTFAIQPGGTTTMTDVGATFSATADGFSNIRVLATAGGTDSATVHDTAGNDTFMVQSADIWSRMSGTLDGASYLTRLDKVENVTAAFDQGGSDVARFYDTTGNDTFTASYASALLTTSGSAYRYQAEGFDEAHAFADNGGNDVAVFSDKPGVDDDFFTLLDGDGKTVAKMADCDLNLGTVTTMSYFLRAVGFDQVTANAGSGTDTNEAYLWGSRADDHFIGTTTTATLQAVGLYYNIANGFDLAYTVGKGGTGDVAEFYGWEGNDWFKQEVKYGRLTGTKTDGSTYFLRAFLYDQYYAEAGFGGSDKADLTDTAGNDRLTAGGNTAQLDASTLDAWAVAFDRVNAKGTNGGTNTKTETSALDFILTTEGDWTDL